MFALDTVYIIPGFPIMLEVFLTGVLIALVGAAGYTFFVFSMKDDREDRASQLYCENPWDVVSEQDGKDKSRKSRPSKNTVIGLILLIAAIIVLILLIWAINYA